MSADQQRQFPGWDAMYQQQAIETMPWFYPELDDDLRQASGQFDLIFDRGCFHVLPPEWRQDYVSTVAGLLKPGGYFFLKCFSHLQPGTQGPHRFTPEQIREIFGSRLQVHSVNETVYQGTLDPLPQALFCVFQREASVLDDA